jgi:DNA-binding MarR family transcriptional regulator
MPTQEDYERLAAFRYALRCFMEFSQSAARAAGLTPQQHQAMLAIKGMPGSAGVTIGDLAGRLLVRHHSAVELVDRLEQNGLLRRDSDGQDGRRALLVLTQKGETALLELSASHLDELSRVGPELSAMLAAFVPGDDAQA